ncbi:MAG: alpha-glucosidase [Lachnospiraceae bacterium]|nr:alpha-glucosidase [Lachnospiraceae bacterium]
MKEEWWKTCTFYQIYPRSFCDSNGDGIGDLRGIISKLDYLSWLGVGAVWLCPVYRSPNADMGYDISDYEDIMEEFGSMADFDELLSEMHKRNIKLVMDLVVNHTSDEHEWFIKSKSSADEKENPYRDFYIWRDGKDKSGKPGTEPNNWGSFFTPSAWSFDEASKQWYLHLFSEKQPDLNWENSAVRNEVYSMINRWFDKGVDGFRMDVISCIAKDKRLPDGKGNGYVFSPEYFAFQPKLHDYLRKMREKCFDGRNCMCVGETTFVNTENAGTLVGDGRELDLLFQFDLMDIDSDGPKWNLKKFDLNRFKEIISSWQKAIPWNTLFWSNHDQPRAVSRFGDTSTIERRIISAKMLAVAMYLIKGIPFIYQGEELGMGNMPFSDPSELRDIESINFLKGADASGNHENAWKSILAKGRDNARTPMQWNGRENAGFSAGTPWIRVNPDHKEFNVEDEMKDESSVLNFYKKLIAFRNGSDVAKFGDFELIETGIPDVFSYRRALGNKELKVFCNFSDKTVNIAEYAKGRAVLSSEYEEGCLKAFGAAVLTKN